MKNFLVQHGVSEDKIYVLEIFDYLCDLKKEKSKSDLSNIKIIYTGNLDKAPFLNQIKEENMNFELNVYGICSNEFKNKKINYKGKFLPDELPSKLEGDLGLVWDGNLDESDENVGFKNYTKYNNPHKLSCYIAAGVPVIVWEKAAVSKFVKDNNIGYTISSIYDINKLDFSDYNQKLENATKLGNNIRSGFYTKRVMDKILDELEKKI
jgi:hypothetical protein